METLGTRIRFYRERANWSIEELAVAAGVKYPTLRALEYGATENPHINTMLQIAEALGVTLEELLGVELGKERAPGRSNLSALDKLRGRDSNPQPSGYQVPAYAQAS